MKKIFHDKEANPKVKWDPNIYLPIFLILTLVALFNSLQVYYTLPSRAQSSSYLIRIVVTKLFYFWYFLVPAYVIQRLSKKLQLNAIMFFRWLIIHLMTLGASFILHEIISINIDRLFLNKAFPTALFMLFNNPFVWIEMLVYALFLLSFYLMEYRRINHENEIKCSQLEIQLVRSKLKELRSKIQPSFLFNTLQTILDMIRKRRNRDANHILSLLSDFLRTTIYDTERDEVSLEEEVRFLNQYLEIEKIRNPKTFEILWEIKPYTSNSIVPNFLLQPIIEEMIYYSSDRGICLDGIKITSKRTAGDLELIINCNFHQAIISIDSAIVEVPVLEMTKERLSQLYGKNQELKIEIISGIGFQINILIPFREMKVESEGTFVMESVL
jgi:two-component system, LytTR family, sensor kinase